MPPPGIAGAPLSFFGLSATIASVVIRSPAIDAAFCRAARTTLVGSMAVMRRASSPPRISPVHPGAVQAQARGGKAADGAFPRPWVRFPWPPGSRWPQRRLSGGPGARPAPARASRPTPSHSRRTVAELAAALPVALRGGPEKQFFGSEEQDTAFDQAWSFEGGALCGGASSSRLWARLSHGPSLRWRSKLGGPIASAWYLRYRVKQLRLHLL
jgi:hypothetical protein